MANGWFDFVNGQTLPASRVQDYLMNQTVMVFDDALSRSAALIYPTVGMFTFTVDTQILAFWSGAAWVEVGAAPAPAGTKNLDQFLLMGS